MQKWLVSSFLVALTTAVAAGSIALVVPGGWSVIESVVVFFWIGLGVGGFILVPVCLWDDFNL